AVPEDDLAHRAEATIEEREDGRGRIGRGDRGEAAQVGDEDRDIVGEVVAPRAVLPAEGAVEDLFNTRTRVRRQTRSRLFREDLLDLSQRGVNGGVLQRLSPFLLPETT